MTVKEAPARIADTCYNLYRAEHRRLSKMGERGIFPRDQYRLEMNHSHFFALRDELAGRSASMEVCCYPPEFCGIRIFLYPDGMLDRVRLVVM